MREELKLLTSKRGEGPLLPEGPTWPGRGGIGGIPGGGPCTGGRVPGGAPAK